MFGRKPAKSEAEKTPPDALQLRRCLRLDIQLTDRIALFEKCRKLHDCDVSAAVVIAHNRISRFRAECFKSIAVFFHMIVSVRIADAVMPARFLGEDTALAVEQFDHVLDAEPDHDSDGLVTILDVRALFKKTETK